MGAGASVLPRESGEGRIDMRCEGESVTFMSLRLAGWLALSLPAV